MPYSVLIFLSLLSFLLTGCSSCSYSRASLPEGANSQKVAQLSDSDSGFNVIQTLRAKRTGTILQGNAEIHSTSNKIRQINYQFVWLDKDNTTVGNADPWQTATLYPRSTEQLKSIAPNPTATHFRIRICTKI